ncbi:unnamed protein product [Leuciscus chuanchicus]
MASSSSSEEDRRTISQEKPRSGVALPNGMSLEDCPVIGLDETVHDDPEDKEDESQEFATPPDAPMVLTEEDVIGRPTSSLS